ncbi:response regulator [Candidatus Saccharibacteria bacterium]|nr:response regulator [Candidatus Saccharibacteria bacterium]
MTKIMLVEDDKSLREIYGVRLLAEGYDIVSAENGEEALAMAIKERPNLVVSDVMMPKISGFDMLDILRSTTETRDIKVIMMTALSSDEQRARGEQLGADRYLVKSQVGIEDVVRVVHEVLGDNVAQVATPATSVFTDPKQPTPQVAQPPAAPAAAAPAAPQPAPAAPAPAAPTEPAAAQPSAPASPTPAAAPAPQTQPAPASTNPVEPASSRNRTISPINDPFASKVNIADLLDKELAKEAGLDMNSRPPVLATNQEQSLINGQIKQFTAPTTEPAATSQDAPATPTASLPPAPIPQPPTFTAPTPQSGMPPLPPAPTAPGTPPAQPKQ